MKPITEDKIEYLANKQLVNIGWEYIHALKIAKSQSCGSYD